MYRIGDIFREYVKKLHYNLLFSLAKIIDNHFSLAIFVQPRNTLDIIYIIKDLDNPIDFISNLLTKILHDDNSRPL